MSKFILIQIGIGIGIGIATFLYKTFSNKSKSNSNSNDQQLYSYSNNNQNQDEDEENNRVETEEIQNFICPISLKVMTDPVISPQGFTFERSFITEWIRINQTCPFTKEPLSENQLISNRNLKNVIESFYEKRR